MIRSVRRLWAALLLTVLVLVALWAVPAVRQAEAERERQIAEATRLAGTQRLMVSDPVRSGEYVRQVALAANVIGDGEQDASGLCLSVSGFESGVGDPRQPKPRAVSSAIRERGQPP